ncbi:hypothetical protein [Paenibacillus sinensis]|nr:hypothetical protein [Paenibacillus sinensis]
MSAFFSTLSSPAAWTIMPMSSSLDKLFNTISNSDFLAIWLTLQI